MKAARRRLSVNRKRDPKAMSIFSKPVTALVIVAAVAGAYLYGRSRLHNPVRPAQASRTAALPPERPAPAAPARRRRRANPGRDARRPNRPRA